jgi:hypothetical protein
MNFKDAMLRLANLKQQILWFYSHKVKSVERKDNGGCQEMEGEGNGGLLFNGYGISLHNNMNLFDATKICT